MGFRGHIIKDYKIEYGSNVGSNYGLDFMIDLLDSINVDYCYNENSYLIEVEFSSLLALNIESLNISKDDKKDLKEMQEVAKNSHYCKDGYLRIEWF